MLSVLRIRSNWLYLVGILVLLAGGFGAMKWREHDFEEGFEGKAKVRDSGIVSPQVIASSPQMPAQVSAAAPGTGFTPQTRLGFHVDNEWEPAIAADRFNHVYVLYPQYGGVPGCPACYSPTMILQISSDSGKTWGSPIVIYPAGSTAYQVDAQIAVDPVDGRTVYAAWLQNNKSDIVVAKSTDFGVTWTVVTADHTNAGHRQADPRRARAGCLRLL